MGTTTSTAGAAVSIGDDVVVVIALLKRFETLDGRMWLTGTSTDALQAALGRTERNVETRFDAVAGRLRDGQTAGRRCWAVATTAADAAIGHHIGWRAHITVVQRKNAPLLGVAGCCCCNGGRRPSPVECCPVAHHRTGDHGGRQISKFRECPAKASVKLFFLCCLKRMLGC